MIRTPIFATAASLLLAACGSGEQEPDRAPRGTGSDAPRSAPQASAIPAPVAAADPARELLAHLVEARPAGPLAPRDDCTDVPGAAEFRHRLALAVLAGDAAAIAAMAAPDVRLGFGGDDGRQRLLERLRDPDYLRQWQKVLELGCAKGPGNGLTMPWYFAQDAAVDDPYSAMIVTGSDVPLLPLPKVQPSADNSGAIARMSWEVVELTEGVRAGRQFQKVRRSDGKQGFVRTGQLRSLLDYRLLAARRGDKWEVTAFVAGD